MVIRRVSVSSPPLEIAGLRAEREVRVGNKDGAMQSTLLVLETASCLSKSVLPSSIRTALKPSPCVAM